MQLTVTTADDRIVMIQVDNDESVENVKAILEVETAIPLPQQALLFNGQLLQNHQRLNALGVADNDLLFLTRQQPSQQRAAAQGASSRPQAAAGASASAAVPAAMAQQEDGAAVDPEAFRQHVLSDPDLMGRLFMSTPELGEAIREGNVEEMQRVLRWIRKMHNEMKRKEDEEQELLSADPFDPDVQRRIEERIQQKNIDENYAAAYEHAPEQFIAVHMLYVDMEVNNSPIKAFVDSGAQQTIMSQRCAERCGLMRLLDKRYEGIARGVGTSKIVGRIHTVQLKIGSNFYMCSITVLEANNMDFLFGLDMLRRHQCCIDLKDNVLRVGGGEIAVPFLSEKDIPSFLTDMDHDSVPEAPPAQPPAATATSAPSAAPSAAQPAAAAGATAGGGGSSGRAAPASQAAAAAPAPAAAAAAPSPSPQEVKVQRLMELGFPRDQVEQALALTGGNEDQAAGILFSG